MFKCPLCLIRKGKTDVAKKIFNGIEEAFQIFINENVWTTSDSFVEYLPFFGYGGN